VGTGLAAAGAIAAAVLIPRHFGAAGAEVQERAAAHAQLAVEPA